MLTVQGRSATVPWTREPSMEAMCCCCPSSTSPAAWHAVRMPGQRCSATCPPSRPVLLPRCLSLLPFALCTLRFACLLPAALKSLCSALCLHIPQLSFALHGLPLDCLLTAAFSVLCSALWLPLANSLSHASSLSTRIALLLLTTLLVA